MVFQLDLLMNCYVTMIENIYNNNYAIYNDAVKKNNNVHVYR